MRFLVGFAGLVSALLAGSQVRPARETPAPAVLAQWSGYYGGRDAPGTRAIQTVGDWSSLWEQLGREPPQAFDPAQETAVAIFLGQRRTGGYRVEVTGVRREPDALIVEYREDPPPRGAPVPQVLTAPWCIAVLPSTPLPITFHQLPSANASGI